MLGDIHCRVCNEPYDAYGVYHGDMAEDERKQFLAGEGCPSCKGKKPKDDTEDHTDDFLFELTDETDEDPLELLDNVKDLD